MEGGRRSQVGRQRVPASRSNVTKRTSTEGFQVCLWIFEQLFFRRTKGALWLIYAERRRQVWQKSAVEMTESERYEFVLNAVFYWEPVEFFQKQCNKTRFDFIYFLIFFLLKMSRAALFWNLLYLRDLFIGKMLMICEKPRRTLTPHPPTHPHKHTRVLAHNTHYTLYTHFQKRCNIITLRFFFSR